MKMNESSRKIKFRLSIKLKKLCEQITKVNQMNRNNSWLCDYSNSRRRLRAETSTIRPFISIDLNQVPADETLGLSTWPTKKSGSLIRLLCSLILLFVVGSVDHKVRPACWLHLLSLIHVIFILEISLIVIIKKKILSTLKFILIFFKFFFVFKSVRLRRYLFLPSFFWILTLASLLTWTSLIRIRN